MLLAKTDWYQVHVYDRDACEVVDTVGMLFADIHDAHDKAAQTCGDYLSRGYNVKTFVTDMAGVILAQYR